MSITVSATLTHRAVRMRLPRRRSVVPKDVRFIRSSRPMPLREVFFRIARRTSPMEVLYWKSPSHMLHQTLHQDSSPSPSIVSAMESSASQLMFPRAASIRPLLPGRRKGTLMTELRSRTFIHIAILRPDFLKVIRCQETDIRPESIFPILQTAAAVPMIR